MPRVALGRQLRSLIWKTSVTEEVEAELEFHVQMRTQEYIERGVAPAQARAAAIARFGNIAAVGKACRKIGEQGDSLLALGLRFATINHPLSPGSPAHISA